MEMPPVWYMLFGRLPREKSGLLRIGQDSHYGENSLGRFVLPCSHSWLYVISLTPLIHKGEVLVVWKRAVSGGFHTPQHWKLSREIMLSLSDEPTSTADTAVLFKCKQLLMGQASISHSPAQTFNKPSSPWVWFKNVNLISMKLMKSGGFHLPFGFWTIFGVYFEFCPSGFRSRRAGF